MSKSKTANKKNSSLGFWLKIVPIVATGGTVLLLITGFIIWNCYLTTLGFIEDDIIKARFILTGFWFYAPSLLLGYITYLLMKSSLKHFPTKSLLKPQYVVIFVIIFCLWIIFYSIHVFPKLPLFFGGGAPRALSLLATDENMALLKALEINNGEGATNQTENICVAYENTNHVIVLRSDRVLSVNKSAYWGMGSVPVTGMDVDCRNWASAWAFASFYTKLGFMNFNQ